ncbi:flagellin [Vreelandella titanicae]|uniref:flagellin n=1 Tax=Vreelandella titanicae TaxID=664683 RepID=UPI003FD83BF7
MKSSAADRTTLADDLTPKTGTAAGKFENGDGSVANFDVDSTGKLTIGGEAAFLTADGELTTNDSGSSTAATLDGLLSSGAGKVSLGGTEYTLGDGDGDVATTADNTVTFDNTASQSDVLSKINASYSGTAGDGAVFSMESGLTSGTVTFDEDGVTGDAFVDNQGEITTTETFDTDYTVDPNTGEVTVTGNSVSAGDYALEVGSTVKVDAEGNLTTADTSQGDKTENPLSALDSALSTVDSLRSDLGAIQNRFESAITNLSTTETNLSAARSRIEDADYAVEVANMTRAQILQQAGTSVLAQANQLPQNVLSLLG